MDEIVVNSKCYKILKLVGKGKSGYSFLGANDGQLYIIKMIHHEPCAYYSFGDKMQSELKAYETLSALMVNLPRLIDYDLKQEVIVKEYIEGSTIYELLYTHKTLSMEIFLAMFELQKHLRDNHVNIDWFPTNFIFKDGKVIYVDYELNQYMDEWSFERWGINYYLPSNSLHQDIITKDMFPKWEPLSEEIISKQRQRILDFCELYFTQKITFAYGYQEDNQKREMLNALMNNIFNFSFEDWYQRHQWGEDYIPYTLFYNNQAIANMGVYKMKFLVNGKSSTYYQIGAVCTRDEFRGLGLFKWLLSLVRKQYAPDDVFFLYAANEAVDFYPMLGFYKKTAIRYHKLIKKVETFTFNKVTEDELKKVQEIINKGYNYSPLRMINCEGLVDFCLPFNNDDIFYDQTNNIVAIISRNNHLIVEGIFSINQYSLFDILGSLVNSEEEVELRFTPKEKEMFITQTRDEHFFISDENIDYFLLPVVWRT